MVYLASLFFNGSISILSILILLTIIYFDIFYFFFKTNVKDVFYFLKIGFNWTINCHQLSSNFYKLYLLYIHLDFSNFSNFFIMASSSRSVGIKRERDEGRDYNKRNLEKYKLTSWNLIKKDNLIQLDFEGVGAKGCMYSAHSARYTNKIMYVIPCSSP